jgi:hypothetical protein
MVVPVLMMYDVATTSMTQCNNRSEESSDVYPVRRRFTVDVNVYEYEYEYDGANQICSFAVPTKWVVQ